MSKMGQYVHWCEEQGYTNSQGEVDSMEYAEEYMKTQQYAKEHDKQTIKVAKNNENSQHKQSVLW